MPQGIRDARSSPGFKIRKGCVCNDSKDAELGEMASKRLSVMCQTLKLVKARSLLEDSISVSSVLMLFS